MNLKKVEEIEDLTRSGLIHSKPNNFKSGQIWRFSRSHINDVVLILKVCEDKGILTLWEFSRKYNKIEKYGLFIAKNSWDLILLADVKDCEIDEKGNKK